MNELLNERLSQLMDDETEDTDGRIIDELLHNQAARDTWWRYHLVSDVLKHEEPLLAHRDLARRISAAMETEPAILVPKSFLQRRNWVKPLAGLAVAASVAVVAIIGLEHKGGEIPGNPALNQQTVAQTAGPVTAAPRTMTQSARRVPEPAEQVIQELSPVATPIVRQFQPPTRLASIETREDRTGPGMSPEYSRMNSYLLNYNEYRTKETRMQGMLPYVRIIAHESDY